MQKVHVGGWVLRGGAWLRGGGGGGGGGGVRGDAEAAGMLCGSTKTSGSRDFRPVSYIRADLRLARGGGWCGMMEMRNNKPKGIDYFLQTRATSTIYVHE